MQSTSVTMAVVLTMMTTMMTILLSQATLTCAFAVTAPSSTRGVRHRPTTATTTTTTTTTTTKTTGSSLLAATTDATLVPDKLSLFSPCKINLFLRILRKRPDGYHDLASLFQAVGFGDTLELSILSPTDNNDTAQHRFRCNMKGVPTDSSNLVLRALDLVREKTGMTNVYFDANLIKECPAQAGLGGGSANAATAMFGANELMGRPATLEQLVEWSGDIGSDITFFLSEGTAYCTGRGEIMTPTDPPKDSSGSPVCIVKPDVGLSTPAVFKSLDYELLSTTDPDELKVSFLECGVTDIDDDKYINDLEAPAFANLPQLAELKQDLQAVQGFSHVMMSGSGTSIFCIGEPADREAFDAKFGTREDLQVFFAEFIQRPKGKWYSRPGSDEAKEEEEAVSDDEKDMTVFWTME